MLVVSRHRQVMNLETKKPIISSDVFLAPNASVIGNVELQSSSSVWYGAVIRGDTAPVEIGERSCISDRAVIRGGSRINNAAFIGTGAVIDGADIGPNANIGAGAVISNGVVIERGGIVRPGSFVPDGISIGRDEIWAGSPAQMVEVVGDVEKSRNIELIERTMTLAGAHAVECGKTFEQLEAEALRQELMEGRTEDYNSHVGILGREEEVIEGQAQLIETDREEQRKIGAA